MQKETDVLGDVRLQFNIQNPTLEDCYVDGYELGQAETAEDSNPYQEGTTEFQSWADGWWAGFYGEDALFDLAGNVTAESAEQQTEIELPTTAANEAQWEVDRRKLWIKRTAKIAAILFVAAAAYEVADMAA